MNVLFPEYCNSCSAGLLQNEKIICTKCLQNLDKINLTNIFENEVKEKFKSQFNFHKAFSFLYYKEGNSTQKLIHGLKFFKQEEIGGKLSQLMINDLDKLNFFEGIDYIIPVPVHKKRLHERGYNQLHEFCDFLGMKTEIPVEKNLLKRIIYNESLSKKNKTERKIIFDSFHFTNDDKLVGKHFLLIDDVITTGSTLVACANEINKIKKSKISVLSISYTKN